MKKEIYENPRIRIISMAPDESIMKGVPTASVGFEPDGEDEGTPTQFKMFNVPTNKYGN